MVINQYLNQGVTCTPAGLGFGKSCASVIYNAIMENGQHRSEKRSRQTKVLALANDLSISLK